MAYSDFTLATVREAFGLVLEEKRRLFIDVDEYYINQIDKILAILMQPLRPEPVLVT